MGPAAVSTVPVTTERPVTASPAVVNAQMATMELSANTV